MARQDARPLSLLRGPALPITLAAALLTLAPAARADFHLNGDFDCSYAVDLTDLSILLANFGGPGTPTTGDMDGNLLVELADLALFLPNFGDRGCCAADLDGDAAVAPPDLAILIGNFGMMAGAVRTDGDLDDDGDVDAADLDRMTCAIGTICCYDVNGDGVVDLTDVVTTIANVGLMAGATFELGDVNCDGAVTDADVALVAGQVGRSC